MYVDVIANSFIQNGARKLYNKLVHECSRAVLDKKVVGVSSRKVDVLNLTYVKNALGQSFEQIQTKANQES